VEFEFCLYLAIVQNTWKHRNLYVENGNSEQILKVRLKLVWYFRTSTK